MVVEDDHTLAEQAQLDELGGEEQDGNAIVVWSQWDGFRQNVWANAYR